MSDIQERLERLYERILSDDPKIRDSFIDYTSERYGWYKTMNPHALARIMAELISILREMNKRIVVEKGG